MRGGGRWEKALRGKAAPGLAGPFWTPELGRSLPPEASSSLHPRERTAGAAGRGGGGGHRWRGSGGRVQVGRAREPFPGPQPRPTAFPGPMACLGLKTSVWIRLARPVGQEPPLF